MEDRCRNSPSTLVLCARSRSGPRHCRAAADTGSCCNVQKVLVVVQGPPVRDIASQKEGYAPILRPSFLYTRLRRPRLPSKEAIRDAFWSAKCSPAIQSSQPRNHEGQVLSLTKLARFRRPARRHSAPKVTAYLTSTRCVRRPTRHTYLNSRRPGGRASRPAAGPCILQGLEGQWLEILRPCAVLPS